MLLNTLAAQTAGSYAGSFQMIIPLVLVFAVMYFLVIRPQNKRMKEQQAMQSSIKIGDSVATSGGLIGRVVKLEEREVHVDFNRSGQATRVLRTAVVGVLEPQNKAKTMTQPAAPAKEESKAGAAEEAKKAEPQRQNTRPRSPMNRGRAGGNRKPAVKKSDE